MKKRIAALVLALAGVLALLVGTAVPAQAVTYRSTSIYNSSASKHTIRFYPNSTDCTGTVIYIYAGQEYDGYYIKSVKVDYPYKYAYNLGPFSPLKSPGCWHNPNPSGALEFIFQTYN